MENKTIAQQYKEIAQLSKQLQDALDPMIKSFNSMYQQSKDLERELATIVLILQPVQEIVFQQNPYLEEVFEDLIVTDVYSELIEELKKP